MEIQFKEGTPSRIKQLVSQLLDILSIIGVPTDGSHRKLERMAKACLAVGGITKSFSQARSSESGVFLRTRDIIEYENYNYGEKISSGSYDDIRRKDLKFLVEANIVVSSSAGTSQAVNNPSRGYTLSKNFVDLLKAYKTKDWSARLKEYQEKQVSLKEELRCFRELNRVPVTLPNGKKLSLSYGEHNNLQKAIIEELLPRFGFGANVLYIGDTEDKFLHLDKKGLEEIKFFTLEHEELPDVIAYTPSRNLLFLIEAFHSTGEWSEVRLRRIKDKLKESGCTAIPVFFTAFEDKNMFRQKAKDIAWETEVWIADNPNHLVHFNGYKFLEIHKRTE